MVKRAVFVNMGFDPTAALEIISALSLSSNDLLIVVYPKPIEEISRLRSEQARSQIKNYVNTLRATGREIGFKELDLDLVEMSNAIERLIETMIEVKKDGFYVYFELTGGVRAITVIMSLLSMWYPSLVDEITYVVEVTRERCNIPVLSPAQLSSRAAARVLAFIADRKHVKRKDICKELGVSESYVSRSISSLKKYGLVEERLRVVSLNVRFTNYIPIFRRLTEILSNNERFDANLSDKED
ncbi:MAG: MarR family transcriptional regulator [Nitrososphaerota archaeon]|nr:MarR family transcriptional regulator [Aigarchaeota archaeon]MDW8077122.1 MarR family transcriptional regulator [Nitrososphaerota archaeon]